MQEPSSLSRCALLVPILATVTVAQERVPFPFDVAGGNVGGVTGLEPRVTELEGLAGRERVVLSGVPLPSGPTDIELERVPLDFAGTAVHVDGAVDPRGLPLEGASLWKGHVQGRPDLRVSLGFSPHGSYGWIDGDGGRVHLSSAPGADGWARPIARLVTDEALLEVGPPPQESCKTLPNPAGGDDSGDLGAGGGLEEGLHPLDCPIAVETDFELFQVFGNLQAEQTYVMMLIGGVSDRFFEQIGVKLTYPYLGFYTTNSDPWTAQSSGDCGVMLNEFRDTWAGNIPGGAALGHFLSGAFLGCGVAWVDTLCSQDLGFSLSCCINGGVSFPATQGSNTWDFYVMAHELGHNFGSAHTHNYCPPLDHCADNCDGFTQCQSSGTNMSYCHGCPGGMNNITTYFHPTVNTVMRIKAEQSCLQPLCEIESYCQSSPNSAWPSGAFITASGSQSVTANALSLSVSNAVPDQFVLFYYGHDALEVPFGDGFRCVGGILGTFRLQPPVLADTWGYTTYALDVTQPPANAGLGQIQAGSTVFFQGWYRDPAAGDAGFNLSDGVAVDFCP